MRRNSGGFGLLTEGRRLADAPYESRSGGWARSSCSLAHTDEASKAGLLRLLRHLHRRAPDALRLGALACICDSRLGVPTVSLTVSDPGEAGRDLLAPRQAVAELGIDLLDCRAYSAAPDPSARQTGRRRRPRWLYVEPDGDVLPTQGSTASWATCYDIERTSGLASQRVGLRVIRMPWPERDACVDEPLCE
jgi:hypothetical protein